MKRYSAHPRNSVQLFHHAKQSATDAHKTASKRAIQKMAEAAGDLIGNKIADKSFDTVSKTSSMNISETNEEEIIRERHIYICMCIYIYIYTSRTKT